MSDALVPVRLVGIPVLLWQRSQEHHDELFREFTLIVNERRETHEQHNIPQRLLDLIDVLTQQYSGFSQAQEEMLAGAASSGEQSIDLTYELPADAGAAAKDLAGLLDEADEYCRRGKHLLTLASPPELAAFRRWFLEEFSRQMDGQPPRSWEDYAAAHA